MAMKYSRQRAAILSFLETRKDHPTAELVYINLKEQFPNISLATVYRNLNQLAQMGTIAKLQFGDLGIDRFDFNTVLHQHFVCRCCNAVIDLPVADLPAESEAALNKQAQEGFDGIITGHRLYFCGYCSECKINYEKEFYLSS